MMTGQVLTSRKLAGRAMNLGSQPQLRGIRFLGLSLVVSLCALLGSSHAGYAGEGDGIQIQSFKTHSRVLFSVDETVETHLKSDAKGFEIFFKGISLSDLGAPLGEEASWGNQFGEVADSRLKTMKFSEVAGGVKVQGSWKYPMGKSALVNAQMDTFEYRQGTPPHYVLDFWLKQGGLTRSEFDNKQQAKEALARKQREDEEKKLRAERRIASEKRLADVEDTTRFCREPLNEKKDIFLQFLPVHPPVDFKKYFPSTTADNASGYDYKEPEAQGTSADVKYVRLALDLYRQGKFALVLKTLDFFEQEQLKSDYRLEMKFLRANAMVKLALQPQAEILFKSIMSEAPTSPEARATALFLAYLKHEKGDVLAATDSLLWLETHYPNDPNAWVFHLGVAESLYALNQTDRALKEYEWVVEKAPTAETKAEGALRSADLYLARLQYDQALAGYFQAIHYFEGPAKKFPPIHINRAEALYGLGEYDRAKEAFVAFLEQFPGHPEGWRATYRLGEIEGRKSGDAAQAASRKYFYDTINQFPFSPGATLARLRLIPCGDHAGFSFEAMEHFFAEDLATFDAKAEVLMIPFKAMTALTHIRSLITFGKEPMAVEAAIDELQKPGGIEVHEIIRGSLNGIFRKSVLALLKDGKKYEALTFYKEKSSMLPKVTSSPEETDYLLKLSEAASDLGLGSLAKEIADRYTKMNPARTVAEASTPDLQTVLQTSEQHFTQAKALWVSSGMKSEGTVREQLAQVKEESHFSYQRELILALMDQKSAKFPSALAHAVRAQLLKPADHSGDLRVQAWIAEIQSETGDKGAALEGYRNLEKHIRLQKDLLKTNPKATIGIDEEAAALGVTPVPGLDRVMISQGELLEAQGHWGEAAATYARAMEDGVGGDQVVYQYARSLKKTGNPSDRAKADGLLKKLAANPASGDAQESFWNKLAREALADEKTK
jgi:tetratricopeptide (TPR) repeat protein